MRLYHNALVLGLVAFSWTVAAAASADGPADETLRDKGLRKAGTTYVLAAEAEVARKLADARGSFKQMTTALNRQYAYDQGLREARYAIRQMTEQRILLGQQIGQPLTPAYHNQLVAIYNGLGDRLNLLNQQQSDTGAKQQIDAEAATRREAYIQTVLDLRPLVDDVTTEYASLAGDAAVTEALDQLNAASKVKVTLGPSRSFAANAALLEKAEKTVLTESVDLRKEGGIFWVDVTFNGKLTRAMAFDTGASDVVLPSDLAAEIGLVPGPDDPIVRCRVADGSIIEARQMTVPSMRVGKFTIKDVSCTVMPADKKDVPPLLGQAFQKNFSLKFSPDSGKLVLSLIDAPEVAPPAAKTKGKASAKKP